MSQKSSLYRTIEILKELNTGKKLCITQLAHIYDVSERTIRRDFQLIKELFGDFVSKEGECYQAYEKVLLEDVLSATDLMTLANIVNLFGVAEKEFQIADKTKALIKQSMSVYDFKSRPFESMKNSEILKKLEHAIRFNREVKVSYQNEQKQTKRLFHPYKILFLNENFYLVGENVSRNTFEFLRISMITGIENTKRSFYCDRDIERFIARLQTPWAAYGKEEIVVKLRIAQGIRRYFVLKKYLPSQEIVHTYENGDIEVHYRVSSLLEVEELVIKWLPHVEIITPKGLNKMLKRLLSKKLMALKQSNAPE